MPATEMPDTRNIGPWSIWWIAACKGSKSRLRPNLGVETDHIAIRTSYRGMNDYLNNLESDREIQVHGLQYLFENMNADDALLIVDDVYSSGRNVAAVIDRLQPAPSRTGARPRC